VSEVELQRDLQELREAYRRKLPAKLARLEELLDAAREVCEREALEAARLLAHTLKGTSGSYGLEGVSADLARIEEQLDRRLGGELSDTDWSEIERILGRVRDRLDAP
jgi:chemotaxis protein histidine kinase CheA